MLEIEKIEIVAQKTMTEGGCNACLPLTSKRYSVRWGERKAVCSEWTGPALLECLAVMSGYRREEVYEMGSEYECYRQGTIEVKVIAETKGVMYQKGGESQSLNVTALDVTGLEQTSAIALRFFGIGPLEFQVKEEQLDSPEVWREQLEQQTKQGYLFE